MSCRPLTLLVGSATPARRALVRMLRMAYADERHAFVRLRTALATADLDEPPAAPPELRAFVDLTLGPAMRADVAPALLTSLLDDLHAQLDGRRRPTARTGRAPAALPASTERSAPAEPSPASTGSSRDRHETDRSLRDTAPRLSRPRSDVAAETMPAPAPAPPQLPSTTPPPRRHGVRMQVILVARDRVERASLARALVQRRCDVVVVDELEAALRQVREGPAVDAVVLDLDVADEHALQALSAAAPGTAIVGRSSRAPEPLDPRWSRLRTRAFAIAERGARPSDVAELVRRLAER